MDFPFSEKKVGGKLFLREFKGDVASEELVWHQDREDRRVKVIESDGWMLQMDNELPVPQPTNAAVDSGSTHEGAPVQGMSSRGENLPAYQNMSQILFNETLKACPEDSSWFDKNSTR